MLNLELRLLGTQLLELRVGRPSADNAAAGGSQARPAGPPSAQRRLMSASMDREEPTRRHAIGTDRVAA
jgi:hypothetical protein